MSPLRSLIVSFCLLGIFCLAGCGGGSGTQIAPPPTGSYSNASLKGSYAFEVSGQTSAGAFGIAGSLTADGNGNLTGTQDENSPSGVSSNLAITGQYSVSADGRGIATLNTSIGTFNYDFVLLSAQRALITRFDTFATASGTLDLQDPTAFSAGSLSGPFAFTLFGVDGNGNSIQTAGAYTADGTATLSNGVADLNDNGSVSSNMALAGSYVVASNGRGTLTYTTSAGTFQFAFYVVNNGHIKLVETDTVPAMVGDAYRQQGAASNASLNGNYAFTVAGGTSGPSVAGGVFTADGNGNVSTGSMDLNDNGAPQQGLSTTGNYAIAANGRGTLTLNNSAGAFHYAVYPSSGGVLMLGSDTNVIGGTAFAQSATTMPQGNFGLNLTAVNTGGELDSIAQFKVNGSGALSGTIDLNSSGSLFTSLALNGTIASPANGRGAIQWSSSAQGVSGVYYPVSASKFLFLELDNQQVGVGSFELQQ